MKIFLVLVSSYTILFGLTLSDSIELAINNSPKVSISKSNTEYSRHIRDEASSAYHPTIEAGFAWQEHENETSLSLNPSHNFNLSLKYNLFNGLSDYYTVKSKELEIEIAKLENIAIISDLKLAVKVAYTDYLKAKKFISTQEKQLLSLTKQYQDANVRYKQGIVVKNDLLLIEVEKLKAQQAFIKSKSNIIVAKSNLETILATNISDNNKINDFDASVEEPRDLNYLYEKMMNKRSELKAVKFGSKSTSYQKDAVTGNYLPKVNLVATHQINDQENISGTSVIQPKDQTTVGINVTWELYSGMKDEATKKALLEKRSQQNFRLEQLKLDLENQLIQAYQDFKVAKSALYVAELAKKSAQENYRITSDRYSYGDVDTLTLLVSQSNLTEATNAYNNAYYDLYLASQTLKRIVSE